MKRNHKRRKGSPRSQYSLFDYILVIGVVALITGGVYYFAKAFYEPENSQVAIIEKKSEKIKPKALIIEAEAEDKNLEDDIEVVLSDITTSTVKPKPLPKKVKKQKPKLTKPREKTVVAEHEVKTQNETVEIDVVADTVSSEPETAENINTVELEPSIEALIEDPVVTAEPAINVESVINLQHNQVPQTESVTEESNTTNTTANDNVKIKQLDPEDVLPQLFETIRDDKADVLEELINLYASGDHSIDIKAVSSKFEYNALHFAAMTGKLESLRMILNRKDVFNFQIDGRSKDELTNTALLLACYNAEYFPDVAVEIITLLLDHGADIELKDAEGYTSLLAAVQSSHLGVVNLLLDRGADVKVALKGSQFTVLHTAMEYCNRPVLKTLIDHGADLHAVNKLNREPIHEAAAQGCIDGLRELILTRGVDIQTLSPLKKDNKYGKKAKEHCLFGATPLHFASKFLQLPAIEYLFLLCAKFHAKDEDDRIAAEYSETSYVFDDYFEDRNDWEQEEILIYGEPQQTIKILRQFDNNGIMPDSELYQDFVQECLHVKRVYE